MLRGTNDDDAPDTAEGRLNTTTIRQVYSPAKFIVDGGLDRVGPKVLDTVAALCDEVDRLRALTERPSVFGRDRVLVEKVAKIVHKATVKDFEYTNLRETRRGSYFEVRVVSDGDPWDGHVVRITVELDRVEDTREAT